MGGLTAISGFISTRERGRSGRISWPKQSYQTTRSGSHTASLGLAFYDGTLFPERYRGGAFIGQHGSWNRNPPSGYKVIFVPFARGRPSGMPEDVLTGFLSENGDAHGRPTGVAVDKSGALLVADDVGNTVWRVIRSAGE